LWNALIKIAKNLSIELYVHFAIQKFMSRMDGMKWVQKLNVINAINISGKFYVLPAIK
jgi:hypothetical protein